MFLFALGKCIIQTGDSQMLCLQKLILENVFVGIDETRENPLETNSSNRSIRFAAYKQFVWLVYKKLGKGNRRVISSCVLWKIRETFPEENGSYIPFEHGKD